MEREAKRETRMLCQKGGPLPATLAEALGWVREDAKRKGVRLMQREIDTEIAARPPGTSQGEPFLLARLTKPGSGAVSKYSEKGERPWPPRTDTMVSAGGSEVRPYGDFKATELADGSQVMLRRSTKGDLPTLEFRDNVGKLVVKVRYK